MEIKKIDRSNLSDLILTCEEKNRYRINLICNSNDDFMNIAKTIYNIKKNENWKYTNYYISNLNTGSMIRYIHNGYESSRACRCHELISYNCDIDDTFKECVLLPMLRPFEEDK